MFLGIYPLCELSNHPIPCLASFPNNIPPETAIPDWVYLGPGVRLSQPRALIVPEGLTQGDGMWNTTAAMLYSGVDGRISTSLNSS